MKLLAKITDKDLNFEIKPINRYRNRRAARAILFDDKRRIALLCVSKFKYHKLPGGGVKTGENLWSALRREVKEEVGAKIKIGKVVGKIIETRNAFKLKQTSYCYLAHLEEKLERQKFTSEEKAQGFKLKWVRINMAINLLKKDKPRNYEGKFIQKRDLLFLNRVKIIN